MGHVYLDGLRGLNLSYLIPQLIVPATTSLGLALAIPYVIAHGIAPLIFGDFETLIFIQRRIYPSLLLIIAVFGLIVLQLKQFRKLYEHIKNDRYTSLIRVSCGHRSKRPPLLGAVAYF